MPYAVGCRANGSYASVGKSVPWEGLKGGKKGRGEHAVGRRRNRRRDSQAAGEHGTMGDGSGFEEEKEGRDRHVCLYYSDVPRTCDNCDPRGPCSDPTADEARQRCVGNRAREITGSTRLKNRAESKKEKIGEGPMIRVRKQGSPPALGINYRVYGKS